MSERYERLEAWLERGKLDWAVWFIDPVLIAEYDSMYTVFDRRSGEAAYHGPLEERALEVAQMLIRVWGYEEGELPAGEVYDTYY